MQRDWIILRDTSGNIIARFDDWISFSLNKVVNGTHQADLVLDGNDSRILLFAVDYIIEFWRENKEANIEAYREVTLLHRTPELKYDSSGQLQFVSSCVGLTDFLRRNVVYNYSDTARADKSDPAETVMKEYVEEQIGPSATVAAGRIADGVKTGLIVDFDAGDGDTWTGRKAFQKLLRTIKEIADSKDMAFWIEGLDLDVPSFIFRAKPNPYGEDRTSTGIDATTGRNASGNYPVVFSDQLGTAESPSYKIVRTGESNKMIIQGSSNIREISDPTANDSPWNEIEKVVNATSETTNEGMDDKGTAVLRSSIEQVLVDLKVLQHPSLLYGRDYFLGDEVTARVSGLEINQRISEVKINVSGNSNQFAETIEPKLEQI